MLYLEEVLRGVQPPDTRREPNVPAAFATCSFSEVVVDSRETTSGALFAALPGERTDGHAFLNNAILLGARGALVRRSQLGELSSNVPVVVIEPDGTGLEAATPDHVILVNVDDPLAALQRLARFHRTLFTPHVIGITGSVGKTSTKEVVAAVLSRRYRTLKNPRSYNSEATVPISVLRLNAEHEVAVFEMGIYGPGDLQLLTSIARPQIGIVTNVGASHFERMGSIEAVAQAKSELVQALPADGHAILNYDDPHVRAMASVTQAKPFFYGLDSATDLWADAIESQGLEGIAFRAHYAGETMHLKLPLLGRHSVHTALAAIAVSLLLGLGWDDIVEGLRDQNAQLRLLAVPGVGGAMLIDDTYNAAPASSLAALNLLAELQGRKIAVLGDMLELGSYEEEAHRTVGRRVAEVVDQLYVVGGRAQWIADEAQLAGLPAERIAFAASNDDVATLLHDELRAGDYVLVKGSRGVAMERIVAALQRPPLQETR